MRDSLFQTIVNRMVRRNRVEPSDIEAAAQAFVESPAFDVLVEQCGFGTMASETDMPIYHGRQSIVMQIAEMANMPRQEVLEQAARQTAKMRVGNDA